MASSAEPPSNAVVHGGFSALHTDVLETHILTRLDGPALASASCADTRLRSLSIQTDLWTTICTSTWPSMKAPRLLHIISSSFPGGPRSFFSSAYPILLHHHHHSTNHPDDPSPSSSPPPPLSVGLVSAVDVYYNDKPIISKVQETDTGTEWFRRSPFRIDVLDTKEVLPTSIQLPGDGESCRELAESVSLSWIMIDPRGLRAANLSSHRAVSVERHWLGREVQLLYALILSGGGEKGRREMVQCGIVMTCDISKTGNMQVTEVSLRMEDMDGVHLMGKESLVILHRALNGQSVKKVRREEGGRRRYLEYQEMKRERKEKQVKVERALDIACLSTVLIFGFWLILWRFAFI